jgi:cyclic pyranopterin phosphate synthase
MPEPVRDRLSRPLRSLRLSVTDRCNLRCAYCMPELEYSWLPRAEILHFGEAAAIVDAFLDVGVEKLRITGGEPLMRRELWRFVEMLATRERVKDLALTTNGILLSDQAEELARAGLRRITVSLDTLKPEVFRALARSGELARVLEGIDAAARHWPGKVKLDAVVIRGTNDGEVLDLLDFARGAGAELRFIEYMDVGGATQWSMEQVVSRAELLATIAARHGAVEPLPSDGSAPAERFRLSDGTIFGVIASTTAPFCRSCDRSRLTADGLWLTCLYAHGGVDLRKLLRGGATRAEIAAAIAARWPAREDRGAEKRLEERARGPLAPLERLRGDPHLEMHVRGG